MWEEQVDSGYGSSVSCSSTQPQFPHLLSGS